MTCKNVCAVLYGPCHLCVCLRVSEAWAFRTFGSHGDGHTERVHAHCMILASAVKLVKRYLTIYDIISYRGWGNFGLVIAPY